MSATLIVRPRELLTGDLLDGSTVVSVELPEPPAVVATIRTNGAPRFAGIAAELTITRH